MAGVLEGLAADAEQGGETLSLLAPWAGASLAKLFDDAVPLRLGNAFTHLALGGEAPGLSLHWPGDPAAAVEAALAAIPDHHATLAAFMTHEPQTNEVRRSAVLLGGFLSVAARTRLPLRCFEIGASAGLNLHWDRFRYDFGAETWGDVDASVVIPSDLTGHLPLDAAVRVIERAACDRRPTDLTDPAQRRRLLACIWPDQSDRLARSRAAIDLMLAEGVRVDEADALDWVRERVAPQADAATVLYHSVFWQYLPAETQVGLAAAILDLGARASAEAPFAWLRMEPYGDLTAGMELRLTLWPGGVEETLATCHPHGAWVRQRDG